MNLKDNVLRILLAQLKIGYEIKEQIDLCGKWSIQNYT